MTIVMFKEDDWWIAQCIEYDLAAQGKTIDDAQYEFQRIFCGRMLVARELGIEDPLADIPRAPAMFQKILSNALATSLATKQVFKKEEVLCHNVPQSCMLPSEALIFSSAA